MFRQILTPFVLMFLAFPALAQECGVSYEEIITLKEPDFTNLNVWNRVEGGQGMQQLADFFTAPDGSVVAAGSYTKDEDDKTYRPLIIKFTPKGKMIWQVREEPAFFKSIDRIVALEKGFAVIGDIKDPKRGYGVYLAVYDDAGKRVSEKPIFESGANLDARALVQTPDGKGFIIVVQYTPLKNGDEGRYGIIYRLTRSGDKVWRRAYTPGMRTELNNIQMMPDFSYMLTGEIRHDDGRQAGWLLRVDGGGGIQWQRIYPRGGEAEFHAASAFSNGDYLVSGRVRAVDGKLWSAWVMRTDGTGNTLWQRYYSGAYSYNARGAVTQKADDRAIILLDARARKMTQRTHARLLTLSPRGYLMNVEDFNENMGGRGLSLRLNADGARVMSGYAQTKYADADNPEDINIGAFDGWMLAAMPLDPYDDPCQ